MTQTLGYISCNPCSLITTCAEWLPSLKKQSYSSYSFIHSFMSYSSYSWVIAELQIVSYYHANLCACMRAASWLNLPETVAGTTTKVVLRTLSSVYISTYRAYYQRKGCIIKCLLSGYSLHKLLSLVLISFLSSHHQTPPVTYLFWLNNWELHLRRCLLVYRHRDFWHFILQEHTSIMAFGTVLLTERSKLLINLIAGHG